MSGLTCSAVKAAREEVQRVGGFPLGQLVDRVAQLLLGAHESVNGKALSGQDLPAPVAGGWRLAVGRPSSRATRP